MAGLNDEILFGPVPRTVNPGTDLRKRPRCFIITKLGQCLAHIEARHIHHRLLLAHRAQLCDYRRDSPLEALPASLQSRVTGADGAAADAGRSIGDAFSNAGSNSVVRCGLRPMGSHRPHRRSRSCNHEFWPVRRRRSRGHRETITTTPTLTDMLFQISAQRHQQSDIRPAYLMMRRGKRVHLRSGSSATSSLRQLLISWP